MPIEFQILNCIFCAAGRAGIITSDLQLAEKKLNAKGDAFAKTFEGLYLKVVEMADFLRTNLERFPALQRFNRDVELEMNLFSCFFAILFIWRFPVFVYKFIASRCSTVFMVLI